MGKPTVHDIAKAAGVSLATVDRVLNARPGVRDKTRSKVNDAVQQLGYVRDTYAANLARQRQYRFAFVLPEGPSAFLNALQQTLHETFSLQFSDRTELKTITVPARDPHLIARSLMSLIKEPVDGVALIVPETPQVRDAVTRLKNAGIAVVCLVSDLPNAPRDFFVGVDSVAAGRTAALLLGRFIKTPGELLVVTKSLRSRDSIERRLGFDQVTAQDFPQLNVLPTLETHGDPARLARIINHSVKTRRNLVGIYYMRTGDEVLLSALRDTGRLDALTVLTHELTPTTRRALLDNELAAVIAQNVGHLVRSSLRVLRNLCDGLPIIDSQEQVRIEVILRENLP